MAEPLHGFLAFPSGFDGVCVGPFEDNAPPWRNDCLWESANATLQYLLNRHWGQLVHVRKKAEEISVLFDSVNDVLDRLGHRTCGRCAEPCCLAADVSYDFRDLLFIHLTSQPIPPGQPRRMSGEVCRNLGAGGCAIPRSERPWICTWYICAAQKKFLAAQNEISSDCLLSQLSDIGKLRKQVENLFIDAVASG